MAIVHPNSERYVISKGFETMKEKFHWFSALYKEVKSSSGEFQDGLREGLVTHDNCIYGCAIENRSF